ncbi:MAG: hypothetical protein E2O54_11740 [Gammaproteobacteria bacterium]|nr:MAG: hypothetical protein E2O54_11740 [Gammaproteobacteria bacterium]
MLIRFGLHLDGLDPTPPSTVLGEVTLGPQGLIGVLETNLGLPPVLDHPAERLMAYRSCLDEANDLTRFYHRSFQVDPINVAGTLLDWRARWYEAGWTGTFPSDGTDVAPRLRDMADVEILAKDRVPLTIGQRLQRIAADLGSRRTQIQKVILLDDPAELPAAWRAVLDQFEVEVAPGVSPTPNAAPGTDLHTIQTVLADLAARPEGRQLDKTRLNADGSFFVLRAVSRDISARAIAETLRDTADPAATVVIAEADGIILDNAFERSAVPRCGFQHYSRFRAVSQVLKLCLALLWEPINPHVLLQFLIHPLGPVPSPIRRALAEAVASEPGIGGRAWRTAIEDLDIHHLSNQAKDLDIHQIRRDIGYWFESARFPVDAAPLEILTERAQRCANWLAARLNTASDPGEQAMFRAASAQAEALMNALKGLADQGQDHIAKIELDRLLDEVTRVQSDPNTFAEAGRVRATSHPGTIAQAVSQVIWWDLPAHPAELSYPWSQAELAELSRNGVELPSIGAQLERRSRLWRRPILNARQRFILVVHDSDQGYHPLWTQLTSVFENWAEVRLDEALLSGSCEVLPHLDVTTVGVAVQPLPTPKRWWELPVELAFEARDLESYSSLSKLFFHPHEWALTYVARLRTGRSEDLPDGPLLYGSLAHRLFENFFTYHDSEHDSERGSEHASGKPSGKSSWRDLHATDVREWLDEHLPTLIAQEAALLLEPGRGIDRQQVSATLERALVQLLEHLRAAGIQRVRTEYREEQAYLDINIRGAIDLLLTDATGQEIVVDAKWGGERYRGEEIEANRHLQLATYAYMRKTATGANRWPYAAYFIITSGNLLAPDDSVFPDAVVHPQAVDEDIADLWSRGESTYRWRREQLDAGHIEVNVAETEPTARSTAPQDALENDRGPDRFDDFTRLTGWNSFS